MAERIERVIPALRALLAEKLVNNYGLRKVQVAKALGVSPAAISHYVSGSRGTRSPELESMLKMEDIDRLVERMARKISLGMTDSASTELSMFLRLLVAHRHPQETEVGGVEDKGLIQALIERLSLEEEAAKRALELSVKANSHLTKMVLKQMAVDSIRHADILTTLLHIIEKGEDVEVRRDDLKLIAEMSSFENRAEEQRLSEISVAGLGPVITALLTSIDMDEQKHEMLL
ncbi:MAG: helix-turn-helix domain-containing protein, partial [Nitrososphaerota archaeon]